MVDEADDLYALPLQEFVKARDALAKGLRAAGEKEQSTAVKGLKKPTRVAWALNQVAREQPDLVDDLLAAAADIRRAPTRTATEAWQRQVARLAKAADAPADKVSQALYAIAVDDEAQGEFRRGQMAQEPEPGTLPLTGLSLVADDDDEEEESERVDEVRMARERAVQEARRRATDASRRAVTAAEEAERLEQRAREARERADDARREAEEATVALDEAERALG